MSELSQNPTPDQTRFEDDNLQLITPIPLSNDFVKDAEDVVLIGVDPNAESRSFGVLFDWSRFRMFGAALTKKIPFGNDVVNFLQSGRRGDAEKIVEDVSLAEYYAGEEEGRDTLHEANSSIFSLFNQKLVKRISHAIEDLLFNSRTEAQKASVDFLRKNAEKAQNRLWLNKAGIYGTTLLSAGIGATLLTSSIPLFPFFGLAWTGISLFELYKGYRFLKRRKWLIDASFGVADALDDNLRNAE